MECMNDNNHDTKSQLQHNNKNKKEHDVITNELRVQIGKQWIHLHQQHLQRQKQQRTIDHLYHLIDEKRASVKQQLQEEEIVKLQEATRQYSHHQQMLMKDVNRIKNGTFVSTYGVQLYPFVNLDDDHHIRSNVLDALIDSLHLKMVKTGEKQYSQIEFDDILEHVALMASRSINEIPTDIQSGVD